MSQQPEQIRVDPNRVIPLLQQRLSVAEYSAVQWEAAYYEARQDARDQQEAQDQVTNSLQSQVTDLQRQLTELTSPPATDLPSSALPEQDLALKQDLPPMDKPSRARSNGR